MRFLLVITLVFCATLWGQEHKHEIGINAYYDRVNQDYIKFKGLQKQNLLYKGAPSFQITYDYNISTILFVGSGLGFSKRGFTTENKDYSSSYIQIPVRFGVEAYRNRYIEVRPYAGGYIGIPLEASEKIKDNYFSVPVDNNKLDMGIESGANISFKLNENYMINFIPRMQFGLSSIYQEYYYEKRRNIAFSIGIGIIRKI
ncbi:outer membrane beta-barrel protein [Chryseobacterium shandongense]|jgi:hypothetical protein|uniref:outer membrane beta-barrel protein n=1 Tax=Chryseobacterium shandongense TaxID=1493872 RepID=UPI000F502410|nr:outer membrane beta-barrel protein [Chryseobacterium shandongense]AZA58334.1 PorT family protein [Chryseobacterium shandongense]